MHRLTAGLVAAAALVAGPARAATLELRDMVARVTVIPEDRPDIRVEFVTRNPSLPITVKITPGRAILDGGLDRKIRACRSADGRRGVSVSGLGDVPWQAMPQIVVRTPRAFVLFAGGAVFGSIGRTASLDLSNAGCGDWTAGNVDGLLKVSQAGSGDARIGASRAAKLRIAGSGDILAGPVAGPLDAEIGGSGDISATSVAGDLEVRVAGSGDVRVPTGRAPVMNVAIAGSGDVTFGGIAGALKARITGSGEVRVRKVDGPVEKRVMGSGRVRIGAGPGAGEAVIPPRQRRSGA